MKKIHEFNGFKYIFEQHLNGLNFDIIDASYSNKPTQLYKYHALTNYSVESFCNNYLYASHPWEFNDPYDCYQGLVSFKNTPIDLILDLADVVFEKKEIIDWYYKNCKNGALVNQSILHRILVLLLYKDFGIYSMTNIDNSLPMWSYYSNHRGFVLKFDLSKLPTNFFGPFKMNYTNNFSPVEYEIFRRGSIIYQTNIKAKNWSIENEWRLLFYTAPPIPSMKIPFHSIPGAHDRKFKYDPSAIEEAILGYNFFEIDEIEHPNSNSKPYYKLKSNGQRGVNYLNKKSVLDTILHFKYPTSMIYLAANSPVLRVRRIELVKEDCDYYCIKRLD